MNIEKWTKKSMESISECQKIAMNNGNSIIMPIHLLKSLLVIDESLIKNLLRVATPK
jgi:ATP-dependent Clp protease ATP-binding subunit ClpB